MNIGIVGLGLIGGSLARAVKQAGYFVLGADISRPVLCKARLLEIVDDELTRKNLPSCGVVLLGLYPKDTLAWLADNAPFISKEAVVMDTCGVKRAVCAKAWAIAAQYGFSFVGGHPMEGAAKIGFDYSSGAMFKKASMILCPDKDLTIERMKLLKDVLDAAGFGRYEITTPERHDEIIALTSQMAHVVSSAFVKSPLAPAHRGFSAGSFRDMTRVAYLNEVMWTELFMDNGDNLLGEMDGLIARLNEYRDALAANDSEKLRALLREGREAKTMIDREARR